MGLKDMFGKKKKEKDEDEEDAIFFDVGGQEKLGEGASQAREGLQSFSIKPEGPPSVQAQNALPAAPAADSRSSANRGEENKTSPPEQGAVNEQLEDLSSNLKSLVYDFRSFMSEEGSPFNPIDSKEQGMGTGSPEGLRGPGYISAQSAGAGEKEAVENPSDVENRLGEKLISPTDKLRLSMLLEQPKKSSPALSQFKNALNAVQQGTKFANELKSNLDATDMPALVRALNSTDYLLHAVGRKNLLRILEVGTREGWIRPEVERIVLSVAEILTVAGAEADDKTINVNDLLRVVYYLNRLLDPEISDFLSLNAVPPLRSRS
jgi:hypothetical protein